MIKKVKCPNCFKAEEVSFVNHDEFELVTMADLECPECSQLFNLTMEGEKWSTAVQ